MFAGFDDACCDLDPHRRNGLHLTDNDMWRSHGSKANFSIAQCERKKERPTTNGMEVAKARFRGREVTGRAFTLPIQRKIA